MSASVLAGHFLTSFFLASSNRPCFLNLVTYQLLACGLRTHLHNSIESPSKRLIPVPIETNFILIATSLSLAAFSQAWTDETLAVWRTSEAGHRPTT
ncbi:hypothetical protein ACQKWADRAFT_298606 [Trichoderma austrokoningii]